MVEIGIIAGILEFLFDYQNYTDDMRMILATMTISFLGIYAFRYDTLLKAIKEAQKLHKK